MNPKELRIGNYLHDNKDQLCRVKLIQKNDFHAPAGALTYLPNKPIRLTRIWLEDFGFESFSVSGEVNRDEAVCWWERKIPGSETITPFVFTVKQKNSDGEYLYSYHIMIVKIEYVHQLQNLYFALTGEELKLNRE